MVGVLALVPACSSDGAETTSSADCSLFANADVEAPVNVNVRNARSEPLFLSNYQTGVEYVALLLTLPEGRPGIWRDVDCTCEDLQGVDPDDCGSQHFPLPTPAPVLYVEPGGSYSMQWTGLYYPWRQMPAACWYDSSYGEDRVSCRQRINAEPGDYTLTALGWSAVENCEDDSCLCQPSLGGWCELGGQPDPQVAGRPQEASATISYPDETSAEIVFD